MGLTCLHACLLSESPRIYICRNDKLRYIVDKNQINEFVDKISLFTNTRPYAKSVLACEDKNKRKAATISYQARNVLITINEYFTNEKMMELVKHLGKKI